MQNVKPAKDVCVQEKKSRLGEFAISRTSNQELAPLCPFVAHFYWQ